MPDLCICLSLFRQGNLFIYLFINLFGKALLWINNSYISQKQKFEVKKHNLNDGFISYKHNSLDSYSDGTHSLKRIHWWANYVMLNFSKSVPMFFVCFFSSSSTSWMAWGWIHFQQTFIFGWTIPSQNSPIPRFYGILVPKHTMSPFFHLIYDNKLSACLEK